MRKPKPSLYLRFCQPDGKQSSYCRAIFDGKSRLRPFWCLVRGTEEHHPEATYYQRTKRDGKGAWESLGTNPAAAWNKATVGKSVDKCKQELAAQRTPPEPSRQPRADAASPGDPPESEGTDPRAVAAVRLRGPTARFSTNSRSSSGCLHSSLGNVPPKAYLTGYEPE